MAKRFQYAVADMEKALNAVRNGASQRAASKQFGVPRGTLQDKLAGRVPEGRFIGPSTVLTLAEELTLEQWILDLSKSGFPRKKEDVLNTVEQIVKDDGKKTPFLNNRPGETWYRSFMRRHPSIVTRTSETINKARACVNEGAIRNWFKELESFLQVQGNLDVLLDGKRILNADESNFQLCPKSWKVLGPKGWKNVYEIVPGKEKETLTVLGTFNADGEVAKGMIVYPYQRPPKDLVRSVPDSWAIGLSDSGWMKSETFYEYVANVLHPWLVVKNVTFPVLFIVDGHRTHLTYQLSDFCSKNGIMLYCLLPNATHILQPADVSVFRPLKVQWKKCVREWQIENVGKALSRNHFAPLLDKALSQVTRSAISNGFKACGIFPFNPDAIDFSKCMSTVPRDQQHHPHPSTSSPSASQSSQDNVQLNTITLSVIQKLIDDGHPRNLEAIMETLKSNCNSPATPARGDTTVVSDVTVNNPLDEINLSLGDLLEQDNSTSESSLADLAIATLIENDTELVLDPLEPSSSLSSLYRVRELILRKAWAIK